MATTPPLAEKVAMNQVDILDDAGNVILIASIVGEDLHLKCELYSRTPGAIDPKITYIVKPFQFRTLCHLFGVDKKIHILEALSVISRYKLGERFAEEIRKGSIIREKIISS